MKRLLLIGLLVLAPAAFGASSVLTTKGALYSIDAGGDANVVSLTRRSGETKETLVVPATADDVRDHHAQLEYDRVSDRLFVVWIRSSDEASAVMLSWLDGDGDWSDAIEVSNAAAHVKRDELRTVLTRATADSVRATLIHVASWVRDGDTLSGEYSLVAFESGRHASTVVSNFQTLDGTSRSVTGEDELDVAPVFPPLAMASAADGVDVVYGSERGTSVSRIHISARLDPHARLWKPVGRSGASMPPARFAAMSTSPVRAFFSRDRVVLYTNDRVFRFVVFENGAWSPARLFTLDEQLTGEALLTRIRQFIEEEIPAGGAQHTISH